MRRDTCRVWGGVETTGPLDLTRIPDVIVPECLLKCVQNASDMECVSACMEMDDGPMQMGDLNGEPNRLQRVNLVTATGSRDGAYVVHGVFRARPACRVCAIAVRRENAPRQIRAGRVDGENVDGECCVNLECTGPHAGACVKLPVLRAACFVRGMRGAGSRDDALVWSCTRNHAGSVRG